MCMTYIQLPYVYFQLTKVKLKFQVGITSSTSSKPKSKAENLERGNPNQQYRSTEVSTTTIDCEERFQDTKPTYKSHMQPHALTCKLNLISRDHSRVRSSQGLAKFSSFLLHSITPKYFLDVQGHNALACNRYAMTCKCHAWPCKELPVN